MSVFGASTVAVSLWLDDVSLVVESVAGRGRTREVQRTTVLDRVSLVVGVGECVGLVGDDAAGAHALTRLAGRVTRPTSGRMGWSTGPASVDDASDDRPGAGESRVQVVLRGAEASIEARTTVGDYVGWTTAGLAAEVAIERRARAVDVLGVVGLDPDELDRPVHSLPAADRRRVLLARAVAADPDLVVIEDLTRGLGPIDRGQVLDAVSDVRRALAPSVLVRDEDLAFTTSLSDRLGVLHRGRLVEIGPTVQVVGAPAHPYARALFEATPVPRARATRPEARARTPQMLLDVTREVSCRFHPRCWRADARCVQERPKLEPTVLHGPEHRAACFHPLS